MLVSLGGRRIASTTELATAFRQGDGRLALQVNRGNVTRKIDVDTSIDARTSLRPNLDADTRLDGRIDGRIDGRVPGRDPADRRPDLDRPGTDRPGEIGLQRIDRQPIVPELTGRAPRPAARRTSRHAGHSCDASDPSPARRCTCPAGDARDSGHACRSGSPGRACSAVRSAVSPRENRQT